MSSEAAKIAKRAAKSSFFDGVWAPLTACWQSSAIIVPLSAAYTAGPAGWGRVAQGGQKKSPQKIILGASRNKAAITYSPAQRSTIGRYGFTSVFGMGTGVSRSVSSPPLPPRTSPPSATGCQNIKSIGIARSQLRSRVFLPISLLTSSPVNQPTSTPRRLHALAFAQHYDGLPWPRRPKANDKCDQAIAR